jgi:hypothetical protein
MGQYLAEKNIPPDFRLKSFILLRGSPLRIWPPHKVVEERARNGERWDLITTLTYGDEL